jgi:hypothetical protein
MSYFGIPIRNGASVGLGSIISLLSGSRSAPTLALNFLSGSLDSRITFTRASTGTYFDSSGVLQTAAINAPRFDYDPSTLAAQGLLIEEARTNLVLNSAALATQSVTVTAVAHTLSFYGTGTVVLSGAFAGTLVGSGAFPTRSTLTFTPTAGVLILTVTGSATQAQLEAGSFATSYIPTTAAAATRSRDDVLISTLTPWYNATSGTLFATVGYRQASPAFQCVASFNDNAANNRWTAGFIATSSVGGALRNTGGVGLLQTLTANAAVVGATNKIALAISTGCSFVLNGGTVATNASYAAPTVTQLQIGNQLGAGYLNGYLRTLTYYPSRLSNAQLRALTV